MSLYIPNQHLQADLVKSDQDWAKERSREIMVPRWISGLLCTSTVLNLIEGHCRLYPQTFFMLNFSKTGQGKENISQDKNFTEILFDVNF